MNTLRTLTFALVATATLLTSSVAHATDRSRSGQKIGRCTMALPSTQTTVEVRMIDADDLCELVSQALAYELFYAPMIVTYDQLWHYPDATLSCRLRYRETPDRITVHNSDDACVWLLGLSPGWHVDLVPARARMLGRDGFQALLHRVRHGRIARGR